MHNVQRTSCTACRPPPHRRTPPKARISEPAEACSFGSFCDPFGSLFCPASLAAIPGHRGRYAKRPAYRPFRRSRRPAVRRGRVATLPPCGVVPNRPMFRDPSARSCPPSDRHSALILHALDILSAGSQHRRLHNVGAFARARAGFKAARFRAPSGLVQLRAALRCPQ
jgi:hypothetical protein